MCPANIRLRTFRHVCPVKILISLRIRAGWSESSLGAFWIAKDAKFLHANNKDSEQTAWMRRLIVVSVGRRCREVCFLLTWIFGLHTSSYLFYITPFYSLFKSRKLLDELQTVKILIRHRGVGSRSTWEQNHFFRVDSFYFERCQKPLYLVELSPLNVYPFLLVLPWVLHVNKQLYIHWY